MQWIRGPSWDGLWIWSGVPVAVLLWLAPPSVLYGYFLAAIVLDHAHLVAPVGLAWSDSQLRRRSLERPSKFILLPLACVVAAAIVGLAASSSREPAFKLLIMVYFVWNFWHFASQHFGVASLYRWGRRTTRLIAALGVSAVALLGLPFLLPGTLWVICLTEGISFSHWMTDIGLSSARSRRFWTFAGIALLLGAAGFVWKTVTFNPRFCGVQGVCTAAIGGTPLLLATRYGLGFVHFLYSRWNWQLRDPAVRAALSGALAMIAFALFPHLAVGQAAPKVIALQGPDLQRNCEYFQVATNPGQWYGFNLPNPDAPVGQKHPEGAGSLGMLLDADAQGLSLTFHETGNWACPVPELGYYPEVDQLSIAR